MRARRLLIPALGVVALSGAALAQVGAPAIPAQPAQPAAPGGFGSPATPATPATPAEPAKTQSSQPADSGAGDEDRQSGHESQRTAREERQSGEESSQQTAADEQPSGEENSQQAASDGEGDGPPPLRAEQRTKNKIWWEGRKEEYISRTTAGSRAAHRDGVNEWDPLSEHDSDMNELERPEESPPLHIEQTAFNKIDRDGDGDITREEAVAWTQIHEEFATIDLNGNGRLTLEELQNYDGEGSTLVWAGAYREQQRIAAKVMATLDADRNGTLVPEEVRDNPEFREGFSEFDTDGDGELTTQELVLQYELPPPEDEPGDSGASGESGGLPLTPGSGSGDNDDDESEDGEDEPDGN